MTHTVYSSINLTIQDITDNLQPLITQLNFHDPFVFYTVNIMHRLPYSGGQQKTNNLYAIISQCWQPYLQYFANGSIQEVWQG